ncbi:MAG: hypothetical protein U0270_18840 [Labilithrix sp.]
MKNIARFVAIAGAMTALVLACGDDDTTPGTSTLLDGGGSSTSGSTSGAASSSGAADGGQDSGRDSGTSGSSGDAGTDAGQDSGTDAEAGTVKLDHTKMSTARCKRDTKCQNGIVEQLWGSLASCVAYRNDTVDLPGENTDQAKLDACAAAYEAATCDADVTQLVECDLKGTKANGQPCNRDTQCAGGQCKFTSGVACGTCITRGEAGDSCGSGLPRCNPLTSYCDAVQGKCVAYLQKDQACDATTAQCASGLRCVADKCSAPLTAGATCSTALDNCTNLAICSSTTQKCVDIPAPKFANVGESCGYDVSTFGTTYCNHARCNPSTFKCEAYKALGEDCTSAVPPTCKIELFCDSVTNKCQSPGSFAVCN